MSITNAVQQNIFLVFFYAILKNQKKGIIIFEKKDLNQSCLMHKIITFFLVHWFDLRVVDDGDKVVDDGYEHS